MARQRKATHDNPPEHRRLETTGEHVIVGWEAVTPEFPWRLRYFVEEIDRAQRIVGLRLDPIDGTDSTETVITPKVASAVVTMIERAIAAANERPTTLRLDELGRPDEEGIRELINGQTTWVEDNFIPPRQGTSTPKAKLRKVAALAKASPNRKTAVKGIVAAGLAVTPANANRLYGEAQDSGLLPPKRAYRRRSGPSL